MGDSGNVVPFKRPAKTVPQPPKWPAPKPLPPIRHSPTQFAGKRPTPARITLALDMRGLYGPEVDEACGVAEPAVDQWETGQLVPTFEQLERLAKLTGHPVAFFYEPAPPDTGNGFICGPGGCRSLHAPCPTCGR
jgi:hypothetical protein